MKVLTKSLTIRGFIQREFADQRPAFYAEMAGTVATRWSHPLSRGRWFGLDRILNDRFWHEADVSGGFAI